MDLGGGGHSPLLYFFTRHLNPDIVIETGVAAGWSSQAILTALKDNQSGGHLYSSDFPYFRYKNPEKLVGYVVDDSLKNNWSLFIDGDQNNLPKIVEQVHQPVALFHYDSDKSIEGRNFAYNLLSNKLSKNAVVIFDDIQDNLHFKNFVEKQNMPYKVFEFKGKYIGLTGPYFNEKKNT
jgi:predicted O-methyltransferase YrrM